jgi:DNA-binding transcriptional regulator/RsmH inhibitor MraZ
VVLGVLNRIEVWAPEPWETFLRESERILDDVSLDVEWPVAPTRPQAKPNR